MDLIAKELCVAVSVLDGLPNHAHCAKGQKVQSRVRFGCGKIDSHAALDPRFPEQVAERLHQKLLNLLAMLRRKQSVDFIVMFNRMPHHVQKSITWLFNLKTLLKCPLHFFLNNPFDDVQNILKMIIERLSGNIAAFHNILDRDLVQILLLRQPKESIGNHTLGINRHP